MSNETMKVEAHGNEPVAVPASKRVPVCDPGLEGIDLNASLPLPDEPSDSPSEDGELMKWGYVPLYRTFKEAPWWIAMPWDRAHFFMDLYLRANYVGKKRRFGAELVDIRRGELATSYEALSKVSGRNVKTVTKWCRYFQQEGEIKVVKCGRNGIIISICKYSAYAITTDRTGGK